MCSDKYVGGLVYAVFPNEFEGEGLIFYHGRIVPTLYLAGDNPPDSKCIGVVVAPPVYSSVTGAYFVRVQVSGVCWVSNSSYSNTGSNKNILDLPHKWFKGKKSGSSYVYNNTFRIFLLLREHLGLRVFIEPCRT